MSLRPPGQPFTFGGVARYASAHPARLIGVGLLFALLAGVSIATLFSWRWAPVIGDAIAKLPDTSVIEDGLLSWPEKRVQPLGANPFVSFAVTQENTAPDAPVDFAFLFEPYALTIHSFAGALSIPYPKGWTIDFNRAILLPLWGAWQQALWPLLAIAAAAGVFLSWATLALFYAAFVRVLASLMRREITFSQAWKMCVAAQWPGAVLMTFVVSLYALAETTLLLVAAAFIAHFALTAIYLLFSPVCLPHAGSNPFAPGKKDRRNARKNPFKTDRE